jgi:hypothetical protein
MPATQGVLVPGERGYQRDPISVAYDSQAGPLIGQLIARYRRASKSHSVTYWTTVYVENPLRPDPGLTLHNSGKDRLSAYERGFLRSLYYDARIHQWTRRAKPDAHWSLKADWGPVPMLPAGRRELRLRVFRDTEARRFMDRQPDREKYTAETG